MAPYFGPIVPEFVYLVSTYDP